MLSIIYQYYHNLNGNNNSKASSTCVCLWHMKNNKREFLMGVKPEGFFFSTASARLRLGHVEERRSERAPHTRNKYERAKSPVFKQK